MHLVTFGGLLGRNESYGRAYTALLGCISDAVRANGSWIHAHHHYERATTPSRTPEAQSESVIRLEGASEREIPAGGRDAARIPVRPFPSFPIDREVRHNVADHDDRHVHALSSSTDGMGSLTHSFIILSLTPSLSHPPRVSGGIGGPVSCL
ncbi:UDP-glycosyltransferase 75D1-like protein [Anopheles sinensis]|uniref:UDP-glycosyltransferase 75D1-like protein n=1 Tax=Anopheles sinensis TaxID=74873 RepID=A0A084VK64_ANOSI|nr:UDP-glycosyltransferase 75D1-like protein [Anopheles sinensis]